jgi:SAM-dependent methyltransferase
MHLNSELLFRRYLSKEFITNNKVLEIGPSGNPSTYKKIVNNNSIEWHTLDFVNTTFIGFATNELTYQITDPYNFPIETHTYDIVISGQVVEHVNKPWRWIKELSRVTKRGGTILMISPISWPYHEAPIDCWRIFPDGIRALSEEAGLVLDNCLFESLETEDILKLDKKTTFNFGQSYKFKYTKDKLIKIIRFNKLIRALLLGNNTFNIPIEVSSDCVSILRKPL